MTLPRPKPILISLVNGIAAIAIYRYLITGGWLTNHYHLNDPDIINLGLAIFEPLAIVSVIAYWIWQTTFLYRLIFVLCFVQILIGAAFLAFILFFVLSHPKFM